MKKLVSITFAIFFILCSSAYAIQVTVYIANPEPSDDLAIVAQSLDKRITISTNKKVDDAYYTFYVPKGRWVIKVLDKGKVRSQSVVTITKSKTLEFYLSK